jgi:CRP/FNR family cyclic AMP-dependent transcriptional regulator
VIGCKALGGRFAWSVVESKCGLDRRIPVELVSRMMDGSISYDPKARLEPVSSGATVKEGDKIERLKEVRMFEECSQRQLRSIARIARVFDAPAGTMLTRANEPGDEFFLIFDGTASVDVATEKRGPLRPGAFFGEMSLLDGGPRSATIVAETPVRLLVISRRNFSVLLKDVPGLTQSLLMTLSQRVRKAEESAERMGGALAGV